MLWVFATLNSEKHMWILVYLMMASKLAVERVSVLFFFFPPHIKIYTKIIPAVIRKVPGSRFDPETAYDEWKKIWKEASALYPTFKHSPFI